MDTVYDTWLITLTYLHVNAFYAPVHGRKYVRKGYILCNLVSEYAWITRI